MKLSIGSRDSKFGKWSPNLEGPYRIKCRAPSNAYILETLEGGDEFDRAINGKYLKKYIILAFGLILDNQFIQSSALIAGTRRVLPLFQKLTQRGES